MQATPPPRGVDPRLVPPVIITAGALGKLTIDKLSNEQKAELQAAGHTLPSMPPDVRRVPEGVPADTTRVPRNINEAKNIEDLKYENKSAEMLSRASYKVEQNPTLTKDDLLQKPSLRSTANPDYRIEGEIFDCLSPTSNRALNIYTKIADKVSGGQTTRIVLNLERSNVSLEELEQTLRETPMKDLKEIIITKNQEALKFFPF